MNLCNATIETGPRKGLKCKYKKKTSLYCNKHNNYDNEKNKNKQTVKNIYTLPNEIINNIISYLEIKDIINLKLTSKFFSLICNNILSKYLNINNLIYTRVYYGLCGGYIDTLYKILNIYKEKIKIVPLKIYKEILVKEKSKYIQNLPIYETYKIKYDIELVDLNKSFYVYKLIYNNNIIFKSKKKEYLGIDFKIWKKDILFKCSRYDF